jgi:hypothetical protein
MKIDFNINKVESKNELYLSNYKKALNSILNLTSKLFIKNKYILEEILLNASKNELENKLSKQLNLKLRILVEKIIEIIKNMNKQAMNQVEKLLNNGYEKEKDQVNYIYSLIVVCNHFIYRLNHKNKIEGENLCPFGKKNEKKGKIIDKDNEEPILNQLFGCLIVRKDESLEKIKASTTDACKRKSSMLDFYIETTKLDVSLNDTIEDENKEVEMNVNNIQNESVQVKDDLFNELNNYLNESLDSDEMKQLKENVLKGIQDLK